jgi:signal transduction histidine kinase
MPSDPNHKRHVLIVDADRAFVQALSAALRDSGYTVEKALPELAPKTLEQFEADLLLWDIEAPGTTDDRLAQIGALKPELIVLPMAKRPNRRRRATTDEGAVDFIDKSLGIQSALTAIAQCFVRRESLLSEAAASQSKQTTQEANRPELEFLAKVSHELRTPLNAIIGFSELIIRQPRSSLDQSEQKSYIEDIHASGRHLLDLINDILDFARAGSGKLLLQESEADIAEVMVSVNRLLGPRIRDAGLEFNQNLPPHLSRLWCDERKFKRMLLNLLTNAVKFTPSGGKIDVDVSESPAGIVVSVSDTGIGMAKADLPRVLEPFVQVDSAFSRNSEGTGLGLPLVKAMIEIHGGSLLLESEPNKGTTVRLVFPRERLVAPVEDENPRDPGDGWENVA